MTYMKLLENNSHVSLTRNYLMIEPKDVQTRGSVGTFFKLLAEKWQSQLAVDEKKLKRSKLFINTCYVMLQDKSFKSLCSLVRYQSI